MENGTKKRKYNVCLSAEDDIIGEILLTDEEAELVAYATNPANWEIVKQGRWYPSFEIWPASK